MLCKDHFLTPGVAFTNRPFSKPLYMIPALRREKTLTPKSSAM